MLKFCLFTNCSEKLRLHLDLPSVQPTGGWSTIKSHASGTEGSFGFEWFLSATLAKSGPLDFPSEKSFL